MWDRSAMQSPYTRFSCAYKQCSTKLGENISLFSFPRDPERARLWAARCNRQDLLSIPPDELNRNYKLCDRHFAPSDIESGGMRRRLRKGALPRNTHVEVREMSSKKGNKKVAEGEEDSLDINSTDLASLFGNNVEFVIEEDSHVTSISEASENDSQGATTKATSNATKPSASSTPRDFNSSFMSFVDKKVARQQQTTPSPQRAESAPEKTPRAPKRKLNDGEAPRENPVLMSPPRRQEQQLVLPSPRQDQQQVAVPTPTQLFLVNPGPIPLAIQLDPSGVGMGYLNAFPLQSMPPLIVPTLPVALNNQNPVQLAVVPSAEAARRPEPRAVDKVNILRKKARVETPAEVFEEPPAMILGTPLSTPVEDEGTNLQKLLADTKNHLSKATNRNSTADKAEYIMVVDSEMDNSKGKVTILKDKLMLNAANEFDGKVPTKQPSVDKSKKMVPTAKANGDVDSAPSKVNAPGGLCYVPNCSLMKGEKVFLFKAPHDQQLIDVWQKCIGRTDRPLTKGDTVCEKHFKKEDIDVLVQHHDRSLMAFPRLKKTAVPCVRYYDRCCVPRCGRTEGRMFKFPVANQPAVQLWLYMLKAPDLARLPIEELIRYRVCERHFERTSFDEKGELNQSAAPMRHLPVTACKAVEVIQGAVENVNEDARKTPLRCIFPSCPSSKHQDPDSRMFLFPKDFNRCKQWLRICKRIDLLRATSARTLMNLSRFRFGVCSRHFVADDFAKPDKSQLKAGAFPKADPSSDVCIVIDSSPMNCEALSCAVVFCEEGSRPLPSPASRQKQFPFPDPKEDRERYHIWLKLVSNPDLLTMDPEVVRRTYGVCRKHFEPHFYNGTTGESELASVAVPTRNLVGSKRWLFGTKFYQTEIKQYINNCINADSSSSGNIKWKISDHLDANQPQSVCTLEENQIRFPALGYHLEFSDARKPAFEVFNCSKQNFKLITDFEYGEMVSVHSAVIIADDTKVQKEVMQNLIDEMVKSGERKTKN